MFADTQKLVVDLILAGNFKRQITEAQKATKKLGSEVDKTQTKAHQLGQHIGLGIKNFTKLAAVGVGILGANVALGIRSLEDLEDAMAQTEAVIKSTGKAAGISAKDVRTLAERYEGLNATVGDETIQAAENLLLTFTNIRKDAFEPALEAALNMNQALGRGEDGLADTLKIVGKALNDPVHGLTQLQRLGIRLTDDQKKQIDAALKVNDTFGAQSVILAELDKRFGGSFLAGGGTTRGKVAKFRDAIEDIQRLLATALLPTVGRVADALSKMLADPSIQKGAEELGKGIAGLFSDENIKAGADILRSVFETARAAAPVVAAAAKTMAGIVSTAVSVFRSLPPEIQQLAIGAFAINKLTGGIVTNIAGGLISSVLKQLVSGVVNVNGAVVNVNGAVGTGVGPSTAAGGAAGVAATVRSALVTGLKLIPPILAIAAVEEVRKQIGPKTFDINEGLNKNAPNPKPFWELMFREEPRQTGHLQTLLQKVPEAASRQVIATERAEAIAAQKAEQVRAQIAAGDTRTELAIAGAKAATISSGSLLQGAINNVRSAVSATEAAARHAGQQAAAAIRDKDLSVTTNVSVSTAVSVRETIVKNNTYKKYYTVAS